MSSKTKREYTGDEDFDALIEKGIRIMKTKAVDYAEAGDRLAEIKETANAMGVSPRQVLGIYMNKHYRSVQKWMRGEDLKGEPIEEKLCDIQVYTWIAAKLAAEERRGNMMSGERVKIMDGTIPDDGTRLGGTEMWREGQDLVFRDGEGDKIDIGHIHSVKGYKDWNKEKPPKDLEGDCMWSNCPCHDTEHKPVKHPSPCDCKSPDCGLDK